MIDFIFYYLFIGLVFNVIVAALAVKQGYVIDTKNTIHSIIVWPVVMIAMLTSILFPQDK